jgi:hypothetical protein
MNGWSAAATFEGEFSNVSLPRVTQARALCATHGNLSLKPLISAGNALYGFMRHCSR